MPLAFPCEELELILDGKRYPLTDCELKRDMIDFGGQNYKEFVSSKIRIVLTVRETGPIDDSFYFQVRRAINKDRDIVLDIKYPSGEMTLLVAVTDIRMDKKSNNVFVTVAESLVIKQCTIPTKTDFDWRPPETIAEDYYQ